MSHERLLGFTTIAAHWVIAVWHLFLMAKILPAPDDTVNWAAIALLSLLHIAIAFAWWKLTNRFAGPFLLVFFLSALGSGIYEHFLHPAPNNIFMVVSGPWSAVYRTAVILLVILELLGCWVGFRFLISARRRVQ